MSEVQDLTINVTIDERGMRHDMTRIRHYAGVEDAPWYLVAWWWWSVKRNRKRAYLLAFIVWFKIMVLWHAIEGGI